MVDFKKALKERKAKKQEVKEVVASKEPVGSLKAEKRCRFSDDLVNDFTKELDKYVNYVDGSFCNYIYPERIKRGENKHFVAFRYPGATRGCLEIDSNNIIRDVIIYGDSDIYGEGALQAAKKFIGYTLEF